MTFERMKEIEPQLQRLADHAHNAGRHRASWLDVLMASHEQLTKLTGRGAWHEELQTADAYETARAALFAAWCRGRRRAQLVGELAEIDANATPTPGCHRFFPATLPPGGLGNNRKL